MAIFPFSNVDTFISLYQMYVLARSMIYGLSKLQKSWENGSWNLKTAGNLFHTYCPYIKSLLMSQIYLGKFQILLSSEIPWDGSSIWSQECRRMQEKLNIEHWKTAKLLTKQCTFLVNTPKGTFFQKKIKCISQ